jgi:hypothetical protein
MHSSWGAYQAQAVLVAQGNVYLAPHPAFDAMPVQLLKLDR